MPSFMSTLAAGLLVWAAIPEISQAQITVGGNGSSTTDSTSYSGTNGLTKIGSNTVTLTGANTYSGSTTIQAGTLAIGANDRLPDASAVTIQSGGVLAMGSYGDYIGSLTMNGNATVSGTAGVGGAQFLLTAGQATNSTIKTLTATGANNLIQVNIGISSQWGGVGGNANLNFNVVNAADSLTVGGVIADFAYGGSGTATSGAITKSGQGTLILTGDNTYIGGATINGGTVQVGNGGTTGNITGNSAAILNNGTLIINRANGFGLGNAISGTGQLVQAGPGTTTLTGVNTFTGGTTVNAGTLALSNNNANVLSGAVTVNAGATLRAQGGNIISDTSVMTLNGGTYAMGTNGDYIGSLTMNGNATVSGTAGVGGAQFLLTAGQATNSTIKTLTATGANNLIQVNIGISSQWGGVGGNANLNFNVVNAADSLTVGGVIADKAFDGGGTATSGAITKSGQGTLILTGDNTYIGGTTINAGALLLGAANRLADSGAVTVNGGAFNLGGFSDTVGAVTVAGGSVTNGTLTGSSYDVRSGNIAAVLAGNGALTKTTTNTVTLSGANTYTGGTAINAGALLLGAANRLADSGAVTVSGGTFNLGGFSDTVGAVTMNSGSITNGTLTGSSYDLRSGNVTAVLAGSGALAKNGAGTVNLSGANTFTGGTTVHGGTLATTAGERLADGGLVTVNTGGTLALGGDETVAGLAGSGAVQLGGRLITGSTNSAFSGVMSGTGGLTKNGAGSFTLSGANTYTGDTILNGGTLVLASSNALWRGGVVTLTNGTTLTVNQRTFIGALDQFGGTINGAGQLVSTLTKTDSGSLNAVIADGTDFAAGILKRTTGTTTVGAANTFTGVINLQGGTLQLGTGGSFAAGSSLALHAGTTMSLNNKLQTFSAVNGAGGTVALGSGALTVSGSDDSDFGGTITGTGSFAKGGAGTMTLSGANTYTGTTTVSGGTLIVASGGSISSNSIATVGSGAHLKVNGSAGAVTVNGMLSGGGTVGAVTLNSGGTLAVGNSPGQMNAESATWNAGSTFQFEITNATGTAGIDWDFLSVAGILDLTSISSANKMNLTVLSTGLLNYAASTDYTWVFAKAASLTGAESWISGLNVTDRFTIESTGFNDGTQPGSGFQVVTGTDGGYATLSLRAVPEPGSAGLAALGLVTLLLRKRRCRR